MTQPSDIIHRTTVQENTYTATGAKLAYHWPIFRKYRETGYGSIIRATMTLHQACSSHCHYCSTIYRKNADTTTLDEAKAFVNALYDGQAGFNLKHFPEHNARYKAECGSDIRLRGLILSGGGQPNLWPHFAEFVRWLSDKDIDLGLITNGFPKRVPEEVYRHFKWVRISITPEDESPHYVDQQFNRQYLPATLGQDGQTVGYSCVYGPWTTDGLLFRIAKSIADKGFDYCRTLTDCNLPREAQLVSHRQLAERLVKLGLVDAQGNPTGKIWHQLKYHGTQEEANEMWDDGQCKLQIYSTFWDTSGHHKQGSSYLYPCDSVTVLADEANPSERRFNAETWGTYRNTEVSKLFTEPVKAFFDPRSVCSACLFTKNNASAKALTANDPPGPIPLLDHANFP